MSAVKTSKIVGTLLSCADVDVDKYLEDNCMHLKKHCYVVYSFSGLIGSGKTENFNRFKKQCLDRDVPRTDVVFLEEHEFVTTNYDFMHPFIGYVKEINVVLNYFVSVLEAMQKLSVVKGCDENCRYGIIVTDGGLLNHMAYMIRQLEQMHMMHFHEDKMFDTTYVLQMRAVDVLFQFLEKIDYREQVILTPLSEEEQPFFEECKRRASTREKINACDAKYLQDQKEWHQQMVQLLVRHPNVFVRSDLHELYGALLQIPMNVLKTIGLRYPAFVEACRTYVDENEMALVSQYANDVS